MVKIALVITTVADKEAGRRLVGALIERKLIACGHVFPEGHSMYPWKGKIEWEPECTVFLKTTREMGRKLVEELKELHPYEIPELLLLEVEASKEYSAWVESEVQSDNNGVGSEREE